MAFLRCCLCGRDTYRRDPNADSNGVNATNTDSNTYPTRDWDDDASKGDANASAHTTANSNSISNASPNSDHRIGFAQVGPDQMQYSSHYQRQKL